MRITSRIRDIPIRRKLSLVVLTTTGVALILTCTALFIYELASFHQDLRRESATLGNIIGQNSASAVIFNDRATASEILSALRAERQIVAGGIYSDAGVLFASYGQAGHGFQLPDNAPEDGHKFGRDFFHWSGPVLEPLQNERVGTVFLVADYRRMRARLLSYAGIMMFTLAGSFVAAFLLSRGLQRVVSEPIVNLARTARSISNNQDYSMRAEKVSEDELGDFVSAFNQMLARIQNQNIDLTKARDELEARVRERTRELQTLQRQKELILNSAGEGIFGVNLEGKATFVNPAAATMTGSTVEELLGRREHDIIGHSDGKGRLYGEGECPLCLEVTNEPLLLDELLVRRRDGTTFTADYLRTPILEDGKLIGAVVVFKDVTERKEAEVSLARQAEELARSNSDLEQFAYIASHDLQEPLRMVANYTQLLARRYRDKLDKEAHDFIEYAVDGAVRMQGLIDGLLQYSRTGTQGKELSRVDCARVLADTIANLTRSIEESRAEVTIDPMPTVIADRLQLSQLFQNLIGNALKFRGAAPPKVHVSARRERKEWLFSVQDNGIGISPEDRDRIFVIFQRLQSASAYAGTGIGLALCKKIVERHGGRIWIDSPAEGGSKFFFTIPVAPNDLEDP